MAKPTDVEKDRKDAEEGLLSKSPRRHNNSVDKLDSNPIPHFLRPPALLLLSLGLLICNLLLYAQNHNLKLAIEHKGFTGISTHGKTYRQFHTYTPYSSPNHTISNPLWSAFTTNGFVAIPHTEAASYGLPRAQDFPDDPRKGIYVLGGFHDLHCVIYLREAMQDLMAGKGVEGKEVHINHCYDALRQSIQCAADDTLLYTPAGSKLTGDGQVRACRDWGWLEEWARGRSACWPTGRCGDLEGKG